LKEKMRSSIAIFFVVLLMGCANTTQRYGVSVENNQILRGIENPRQIKVGAFTTSGPNKATIECRNMYPLTVPAASYEAYVREALIDELKLAAVYSDAANTELTIHFESIDFSSAFSGNWLISARFTAPNKPAFTVTTNHIFTDVNWGPSLACSNTSAAFVPAVQNFLKTLFLNPNFKEIMLNPLNDKSQLTGR
jgi:hypothetical protein